LTGFLIGKKIIEKKLKTPIIDFGMIRPIHKTRIFAFMKGLIDAGVKIKHNRDIFPEEERLNGKKLKKDFSKVFNEIKIKIGKQNEKK
jgi:large subunit ribosomal protein L18